MSDAIWIALIAALPGLLMTLFSQFQIRRVHVLVNSQKDALQGLLRDSLLNAARLETSGRAKDDVIDGLRALLVSAGRKPEIEPLQEAL